jgi:hypothetical protein
LNRIDQARHSLGDRLELLANAKDAEIARLQGQVNAARVATTAPPKKIIVDEDEKVQKKPVKKSAKKPATNQSSSSQTNNPQ